MKVLHVIPSVAKVRGGTSRAVLEMVKTLQGCGVEAQIATTNDNGSSLLDVPYNQLTQHEQVPVYFFPRFSPGFAAVREFAFSHQLTTWLWQNITNYDLIHVHALFSYASTIAMTISRLKGIPYIQTPHGLLCKWSLQQSTKKKQMYLRILERSNLNHSQVIHLTSDREQQEVSNLKLKVPNLVLPLGLSQPVIVPNARYHLRQKLNIQADEPIILFLSRLHPKKGLDYLISALGKLSEYPFQFVIAGSGTADYENEVKSLLISHGIENRTHLVGFVEGETKNLLLQGSDLFALTSHSENFGVSVLEALAVGLPVLITPGVALASVVQEHNVGYVTELDASAIASTIENHLNNPQQAKEIGDRARKLICEQYTWDSIGKKLIQVYQTIINGKSNTTLHKRFPVSLKSEILEKVKT